MTVLVGMRRQPHRPFAGSVGHANKTEGLANYINPQSGGPFKLITGKFCYDIPQLGSSRRKCNIHRVATQR